MQAFVSTARTRSFSRAAEELGISQPALSQAISDLESDVGYALFDRTTRRVVLTTAGRQFLPSAERVINAYSSAREDLANLAQGRSGRVTLACLPSVAFGLMPRVLAGFSRDYPDIAVDIIEQRADQVAEYVRNGDVDLGISNLVGSSAALNAQTLLEDDFAVVCQRNHPLARKASIRWRDLQDLPIIAMTPESGIWKEIEIALHSARRELTIRYVASTPATIQSLVRAGVGVSPLPGLAWPEPNDPILCCRPLVGPHVQRRVHVFRRTGESLAPSVQLLLKYIFTAGQNFNEQKVGNVSAIRERGAVRRMRAE